MSEHIAALMPLAKHGPALFLETVLHWGAAFSCAATFVVVTAYQLVLLIKRVWERSWL